MPVVLLSGIRTLGLAQYVTVCVAASAKSMFGVVIPSTTTTPDWIPVS